VVRTQAIVDACVAATLVLGGLGALFVYGGGADPPTPVPHDAATAVAAAAPTRAPDGCVRLLFAGGGAAVGVAGRVSAPGAHLRVAASAVDRVTIKAADDAFEVSLTTAKASASGVELRFDPGARVAWSFDIDGTPLAASTVFAGTFGLAAPELARGIDSDAAARRAHASTSPTINAARERGLFVVGGCPELTP
jgi:hypothetical protein